MIQGTGPPQVPGSVFCDNAVSSLGAATPGIELPSVRRDMHAGTAGERTSIAKTGSNAGFNSIGR